MLIVDYFDDGPPREPTYDEQVQYLAVWAVRNDCQFTLEGECGFGRECVGMLRGNSYLDYSHLWQEMPGVEFWTPENAYHKHDCMAVLGRGPQAVRELYDWARWLDEHGWTTQDVARHPEHALDAIVHGFSTPRLVKRAITTDLLDEPAVAYDEEDPNAPKGGTDAGRS